MKLNINEKNMQKLSKRLAVAGVILSLTNMSLSLGMIFLSSRDCSITDKVDKSQNEKEIEIETDSYGLSDRELELIVDMILHEHSHFDDELFIRNYVKSNIDSVKHNNAKEVATDLSNNVDGFRKKSVNEYGNFVPILDDYDACTKFEIATADDTQAILKAYNSELKGRKLTVDDLEYLSQLKGSCLIKTENGNYSQIGFGYYHIGDVDGRSVIVSDLNTNPVEVRNINTNQISYKVFDKLDMLTGEKIEPECLKNKKDGVIQVGDYIKNHDISFSAYHFPMYVSWSDFDKEMTIKKYGMEVWNCIRKYGFPLKVYRAEDFCRHSKKMIKSS